MTTDAIHPGSDGPVEYPFLSQAIRAGDFVFVSGNTGLLPGTGESGEGFHWMPGTLIEGGIEAETRQALANIDAILRAAGGSLRDLVKVNTFLRDVDRDFPGPSGVIHKTVHFLNPQKTSGNESR